MPVFEFIIAIVAIVTIGSIIKARMGVIKDKDGNDVHVGRGLSEENRQLRGEIGNLKDRIAVLERVITDNNSSSANLDREIEALRNRDR